MAQTFSMKDREFMEYLFSPDTLEKAVPRMAGVFQSIKEQRDILHNTGFKGAHTRATGFSEDGNFKYVAHLTPAAIAALYELDPTGAILNDRKKFYAWLRGPGFAFSMETPKL